MARPRTVSDEDMLAAARAVFLEQGGSASTATIAGRLGVSQAALFKRFGTKKDLMVAALAPPATPPFLPLLLAGPDASRPVDEQLRAIAMACLTFFRQMVPAVMVLNTCGFDPKQLMVEHDVPPPLVAHQAMGEWMAQAMDLELMRRGDPAAVALAFLGTLHIRAFFSALTRQPLSDADVQSHVDSAIDALWLGLAPAPETTP
ncbi:MAG: TetR/AcrR family transcriptional regulator [Deltaproteobacteria bacterium]|nr:TetR/AcrR family transcriptional regulator [Deltaproteobacteria bacterium]